VFSSAMVHGIHYDHVRDEAFHFLGSSMYQLLTRTKTRGYS